MTLTQGNAIIILIRMAMGIAIILFPLPPEVSQIPGSVIFITSGNLIMFHLTTSQQLPNKNLKSLL